MYAVIAVGLAAMVAGITAFVPTPARDVVNWTARTSFVLFSLVYLARPATQLWPAPFTRGLLARRKWLGLSFATSHAFHFAAILALASPDLRGFFSERPPNPVGIASFVALAAMAVTSIDSIKRAMSRRAWKTLHLFGIHVAWLLYDLPHIAQWSFARLGVFCGNASIRVLVTQLGLIFGIPMVGITGSAWGMIGTFVGLRALADACIGGLQGLVKRRDLPPGLARFLAARSKQTVDALEAEFDAMKARGREVEALLEQPIDAVRTPAAARAADPAAAG